MSTLCRRSIIPGAPGADPTQASRAGAMARSITSGRPERQSSQGKNSYQSRQRASRRTETSRTRVR